MAKRGQNEGSIFQRKDGRWVTQVNLGWVNGKRTRKSYYGETRKEVQEQLTRALSDIQRGFGHHRFHDLRHTAATLLAVQGVHPRAIQAALGWENLSMLNRYAHFVEEQRQVVASAMDSILTPVAVNVAVNAKAAKLN
jgi:integrase